MDYREIVQAVIDSHPEFASNPDRDDAKSKVLPFVVDALNTADKTSKWGVLVKTEQGNKIPGDIVVWRDDMRHFDVMTDSGALWDDKGIVGNPAWVWSSAAPVAPPIVTPPTSTREEDINAIVDAIIRGVVGNLALHFNDIYQQNERTQEQNERIFANLTAQNTELRRLLAPWGEQAAAGAMDSAKTVHISQQSIERIVSVGVPLLTRLLNKK